MLISKFDLYKSEWLELVFDNRNKEYGAYYLRQHYAGNMIKAMGITFSSIALLCGASILLIPASVKERVIEVINNPNLVIQPPPIAPPKTIKPLEPVKPLKSVQPSTPAAAMKFIVPVVTSNPVTENPPLNVNLTESVGSVTIKGPTNPGNVIPVETGAGSPKAPDMTIYSVNGIDQMPEPDGGLNGWAKFLSRNLRFPGEAQDQQISGRVILSFVIEKDGHLSNIVVERGAGYGFDEEAVRVLKLAKAWKPGMQNGQPVRVKYMIPINFQLADNN
jgi:protein TonB